LSVASRVGSESDVVASGEAIPAHLSSTMGAALLVPPALLPSPGDKAETARHTAAWRLTLCGLAIAAVATAVALQPPAPSALRAGGEDVLDESEATTSGPNLAQWRQLSGHRFAAGATPPWIRKGASSIADASIPWMHPKSPTSAVARAAVAAVCLVAAAAPPTWRHIPLLLTVGLATLTVITICGLLAVAAGPAADSPVASPWVAAGDAAPVALLAGVPLWSWFTQAAVDATLAACAWSYRSRLSSHLRLAWLPRRALLRTPAAQGTPHTDAAITAAPGGRAAVGAGRRTREAGRDGELRSPGARPGPAALGPDAASRQPREG